MPDQFSLRSRCIRWSCIALLVLLTFSPTLNLKGQANSDSGRGLPTKARSSDKTISITWSDPVPAGGAKGATQLRSGEILATTNRWTSNRVQIVCSRSTDNGVTWEDFSVIAEAGSGTDIGDGDLRQLADGDVLYSYRHNSPRRDALRSYSIRVAVSKDRGKTWKPHSQAWSKLGI